MLRLCLDSFCSVLRVNKRGVQRLAKFSFENEFGGHESRGGARHFEHVGRLRSLVKTHIETFKCVSSHYGRKKIGRKKPNRKYISASYSLDTNDVENISKETRGESQSEERQCELFVVRRVHYENVPELTEEAFHVRAPLTSILNIFDVYSIWSR